MDNAGRTSRNEYYRLFWKKGVKQLPFFLMVALVTGLFLSLVLLACRTFLNERRLLEPVAIGIVIPDGDPQTTSAARIVESMDSVKSICTFEYTDENSAEKGLSDGTLDGVIRFDSDMYESVTEGSPVTVTLQMRDDRDPRCVLFKDLISSGISFLHTSESAVYTILDVSREFRMKKNVYDVQYDVSMKYLTYILNRGRLWDTETLSAFGHVDILEYYVFTGMILLMLLFGMSFSPFYDEDARKTDQALKARGVRGVDRSLARTAGVFCALFTLFLILLGAASLLLKNNMFSAVMVIAGLLLCVSAAALIHFLFSVIPNRTAPAAYLLITLCMFLLGGGLIPAAYLPKAARRFSRFLPFSLWQELMTRAQTGDLDRKNILLICLVTVVLFAAGYAALKADRTASRADETKARRTGTAAGGRASALWLTRLRLIAASVLKRPSFYFILILALVLGTVFVRVYVPDSSVSRIGVFNTVPDGTSGAGAFSAGELIRALQEDDAYEFVLYDSEEELREDVLAGKNDCGIIIEKDPAEATRSLETDGVLKLVSSTSSTKSLLVREKVFAVYFRAMSDCLLTALSTDGETYLNESEELTKALIDVNHKYLEQSGVLTMHGLENNTAGSLSRDETRASEAAFEERSAAARTIAGLLIFACALLFSIYRFSGEYKALSAAMKPRERLLWLFLMILIPVFFTALIPGIVLKSPAILILCPVLCSLWALVYSLAFKKDTVFLLSLISVLLLCALYSPAVSSYTSMIPALRYLKYLFPVTYF